MIHQLIFAAPKPGMTEEEFHKYWLDIHAVKYVTKIPQIKRYMIDTRVEVPGETKESLFSGVAEIWLENEKTQLESLQTKEFLEGARLDEPRWASFWKTLVLDTDSHVLLEGKSTEKNPKWIKHITLYKRKSGMLLSDYRNFSLKEFGALELKLPGIRRYIQCHVRDSAYVFGESRFDSVNMLWFDSVEALLAAYASPEYKKVQDSLKNFAESKYVFPIMAAKEHWIIGPEAR